ncbi:hypothetical protein TRIP_D300135 [uncultured Paludibacter sp.]|nr:hypothetical protein TRIP_D300135 [uncultured Paludibacter sp.]
MNRLVSGAIGIEIHTAANDNKIYFPDVALLRGKRIKHIDVISNIVSKNGFNPIAENYLKDIFVTFMENKTQTELIKSLPLSLLSNNNDRLFINKSIDLVNSFIDVSKIDTGIKDNAFLYFIAWFDEPFVWGKLPEINNRTEIHPLELTLTQKRTYFSENKTLLNRRVQNLILTFPYYTPTGQSGISEINIANKYITLSRGQVEFMKDIPISVFVQTDDNFTLRLQNIVFDLQNSYIETTTTTADDLKAVFFNVIVDDNNK